MASVCFTDLKKALEAQDDLPAEAKNNILEEVEGRQRARMEKRLEPRAKALRKSIEDIIQERKLDQASSRKKSLLAIKKRIAAQKQIAEFPNATRGVYAFISGVESNLPKSRFSLVAKVLFDQQTSFAKFLKPIEDQGLLKILNDKKNDREIGRAIWNKGHQDKNINEIAKAFLEYEDWSRSNFSAEAVDIGKADDRIAKMVHNSDKMRSATGNGLSDNALRSKLLIKNKGDYVAARKEYAEVAYNRWKGEITPKLNEEKTFENVEDNKRDKFLRGVYEGLVTGIHKTPYTDTGHPLLTRTGNIGKKLEKERVLYFKDADNWIDYNSKYGHGNVHDAMLGEIEGTSRQWSVIKTLGTSPRTFMDRIFKKAAEDSRDIGNKRQNERFLRDARNTLEAILGDPNKVEEGMLGKIINNFRMFTYLSRLGNITPASIPDINIMISACRQHNIPAVEVMSEAFNNLLKGQPKGQKLQLGLDVGVYSKGTIGGITSKFGNVDTPGYMLAKGMKLVDKLTLINRWDSMNRLTMGTLLSRRMAKTLDTDFDKIPANQQRTMVSAGIDKDLWEVLQRNKMSLTRVDGQRYLTPEIANQLTDEEIKSYSKKINQDRKTFTAQHLDKVRMDIKDRLGTYFTDQTAYGKVFPNASDHALMNFGVKSDTLPGKLWQLITMFKSFHIASLRRTYGRFLYGNGAESLYDAIFHGKADFSGMINYMIGGLPWNYMSMAAESVAKGMTPPSLDDRKTWSEMFQRSVIPLYGSILQLAQADNSLSGLSPALATAEDMKNLLKNLAEGKDVRNQATWMLQSNIPIIKTFYTQLALNRGIWDKIHSSIDPTYDTKLLMKAAQNNQSYWAPPTS